MATKIRAGLYTKTYTIDEITQIQFSIEMNDERNESPLASVGQWIVSYEIRSVNHSDEIGIFEVPFNTKKEALCGIDAYMKSGSFSHLGGLGWCHIEN